MEPQIVHTSIELAPTIMDSVLGLVKLLLAKKFAGMLITSMAIGGLTFGLLELFMRPGLKFAYGTKKMAKDTSTKLTLAILIILCPTFLILTILSPFAFQPNSNVNFIAHMTNIGIVSCIMLLLCWLFSWILKKYLAKEKIRSKHILILEAFHVITATLGSYLSEWLTRLIMSIINMGIKIVHRPFILEYGIVAVVLNLLFSFLVLGIMGQSNDAGAANLAGSLLGGLAHAIIRRKKVAEMRKTYLSKFKKDHNKEVI